MGSREQGATATTGRWLVIPRTLCFVFHGDEVLLMKRGPNRRVFPNRFNGLGGHMERGEDPATCARREIREESGLEVKKLRLRGVYNIDTNEDTGIVLYIYTAIANDREITVDGDEEGTLHWISKDEVLDLDLVEDLPLLFSRLLSATEDAPVFSAHLSYDDEDNLVLKFANNGD